MPQLTPVILQDDAQHEYVPVNIVGGVGFLNERTGVPMADPQLSVGLRQTGANYRSTLKLVIPVACTDPDKPCAPDTVIMRAAHATVEFTFPRSSTEDERKAIVEQVHSLLSDEQTFVRGVLVDLSGVY